MDKIVETFRLVSWCVQSLGAIFILSASHSVWAGGYHGVQPGNLVKTGTIINFKTKVKAARDKINEIESRAYEIKQERISLEKAKPKGPSVKSDSHSGSTFIDNQSVHTKTLLVRMNPVGVKGLDKANASFRKKILEVTTIETGLNILNSLFDSDSGKKYFSKHDSVDVYLVSFNADLGLAKLKVVSENQGSVKTFGKKVNDLESLLRSSGDIKRVYPDLRLKIR